MGSAPATPTARTRSPGMTPVPPLLILGVRVPDPLPGKNLWWDPTEKSPGAGCELQQAKTRWEEKRERMKGRRNQQCPQRDSSHSALLQTHGNPWGTEGNPTGKPQPMEIHGEPRETQLGNLNLLKLMENQGKPSWAT